MRLVKAFAPDHTVRHQVRDDTQVCLHTGTPSFHCVTMCFFMSPTTSFAQET